MTKTIIVDDNPISRFLIKKALQVEGLGVCHADSRQALLEELESSPIELVLINQSHQNNSGWTVFNQIKSFRPGTPVMLYVLPDHRRPSIDWIVKAVLEAVPPKPGEKAQSINASLMWRSEGNNGICF